MGGEPPCGLTGSQAPFFCIFSALASCVSLGLVMPRDLCCPSSSRIRMPLTSRAPLKHRLSEQFSGLWYVVSMVSDCKVFLGKKDHLLMSSRTIRAMPGGNLSVHMEFPRADGCHQLDAEYLRVGSEGHFRVPALGYLDVRVADTDYDTFAVLYIYKELEGALSTMVQLYSRTQEASPQATKAFQDFYPTVGLPNDMMVMLPKSGVWTKACPRPFLLPQGVHGRMWPCLIRVGWQAHLLPPSMH
uniref:Lipocalin 15 n=1 Tax=Canis lupus familiaris TaxID=9615 RepID=A0A8P0NY72_CANLF